MAETDPGDDLIEACRRGDRRAFALLFETYKDRVYTIALGYVGGDESAARDITQQVFLKLITSIDRFDGRAGFTTWLYRMVVNACTDRHRTNRLLVFLADLADWRQASAGPSRNGTHARERPQEDDCIRGEVEGAVRAEVARLGPRLRMPVLLRHYEGLSYDEIGRVLNCAPGTVASRLSRAHKVLARRLAHLRATAPGGE